jgi:class 3 adenylate cyclase
MKKKVIIPLFLLIFLCLFPLVNAKIFFEQPSNLYSLGQKLTMTTKLLYDEDFNGYTGLDLICKEGQEEIKQTVYFSPINLKKNKEKQFIVSFQVMKIGQCYFQGKLEDIRRKIIEIEQTSEFTVSNLIEIELEFNKLFFMPGDEIEIKGTAVKENGGVVDGFITGFIELNNQVINQTNQTQTNQTNLTFSFSVINGKYNYKLKFSKDILPGDKKVSIKIEDEYGNEGYESREITIAIVPTELVLEIYSGTENNSEIIMPGKTITIKSFLLDQAGQIMEKNISLSISDSKKVLLEQFVQSGENITYTFKKNEKPGEYNIKTYGVGLETEKTIYLSEIKEIDIELENDTLHITNIGNVPYKEAIEITFTKDGVDEIKIIDLNLDVGQDIYIKLVAPSGEYEVSISGPRETLQETLTFRGVPLTGEVVATVELEKENSSFPTFLIIILVAIIIFLGLLYVISEKRRRKYKGFTKTEKQKEIKKEKFTKAKNKGDQKLNLIQEKSMFSQKQDDFNLSVKRIFQKHSQRIGINEIIPKLIFGNKRPITTMFMRIDGLDSLRRLNNESPTTFESILNDYFSRIIDIIRTYQGIAEIYENTIFVMFNVIKQYSHDMAAIKTASDIRNETARFNERYKPLAKFYVASGINTGTAMVSTIGEDRTLKYLSLNNTTQIAKELEKKANSNNILISQNTYSRLKNSINARKIDPLLLNNKESIETYNLEQLSLRDKYKDRIDKVVRDFKKY